MVTTVLDFVNDYPVTIPVAVVGLAFFGLVPALLTGGCNSASRRRRLCGHSRGYQRSGVRVCFTTTWRTGNQVPAAADCKSAHCLVWVTQQVLTSSLLRVCVCVCVAVCAATAATALVYALLSLSFGTSVPEVQEMQVRSGLYVGGCKDPPRPMRESWAVAGSCVVVRRGGLGCAAHAWRAPTQRCGPGWLPGRDRVFPVPCTPTAPTRPWRPLLCG